MKGKLYLVPTPIGNLQDMTYRAVEVLRNVDTILAEDTRKSGLLLKHYGIETPMQAHHAHNEHEHSKRVIAQMERGKSYGLITDAGTPGISDPGFLLLKKAVEHQLDTEVLPGATAFVPAVIQSALPNHAFTFYGFLPVKKGRKTQLEKLKTEQNTFVLYESPHKIQRTLRDLNETLGGNRRASLSRELTKKFEETLRGTLNELKEIAETRKLKGEIVLVVEGNA